MRSTISLLLISISIVGFSQRVSFEDPDLTFSFKKPKTWQVFDDGYSVKVAPSASDSSHTFLSITYFEDARPLGGIGSFSKSTGRQATTYTRKIDGVAATFEIHKTKNIEKRIYHFYKYNQRFEVITSLPGKTALRNHRTIKNIIRSIRIMK